MTKHRTVFTLEYDRERPRAGILGHQRAIGTLPERGWQKFGIEDGTKFGCDGQHKVERER
jgi:hypothetical protein